MKKGGMMKRLFFMVTVLLLVFIFGCTKAGEKVLLIFSYHSDYSWVTEETRGVEEIFEGKGITVEKFYMDTKRKTSQDWKEKAAGDAMKKIDEFKPDLVIVFDDNACEYVAKRYIDKTLPFVFCGMNNDPEYYGFPTENITGVIERVLWEETINLLKQLVPDAKRAAIISDSSFTSQIAINRLSKMSLPLKISEVYTTDDFDDWKTKVKELQTKVDAIGLFLYHTVKEKGEEKSLPPENVLSWTLNNSKLPEFAVFDFTVKDGGLCGVTLSGYDQGKAAAEIAVRILDGEKPANIPIRSPEKGKPIVNETRAKELGIVIPAEVLDNVEIQR
jgi:ABC-type uncharacterized transport system substrate-binding protein